MFVKSMICTLSEKKNENFVLQTVLFILQKPCDLTGTAKATHENTLKCVCCSLTNIFLLTTQFTFITNTYH